MVTPSTGTGTALYLFDRYPSKSYESSGDNDDLTTTSIVVEFPSAVNVNRIALQNINLKSFKIYHSSNTANLITLTTTCGTNSSEWTGNSSTNLYLIFATTNVTSIGIAATATIDANEEKRIGELWISRTAVEFDRNPSARDYKVSIDRKEYSHIMSDGGTAIYVIGDNYKADIRYTYVNSTTQSQLEDIHNEWSPFVIVPDPTGTSWSAQIYEVNWIGDFDFVQYSDNYKGNGYQGTIRLRETPK